MRRSLCPSVRRSGLLRREDDARSEEDRSQDKERNANAVRSGSGLALQRAPLFSFLSKPPELKKPFKLPGGAKRSADGERLFKRRTLGVRRSVQFIKPNKFRRPVQSAPLLLSSASDEGDEEGDPEASSEDGSAGSAVDDSPYEPLVLWESESDPERSIAVDPRLCRVLRPHQREGVQFVFECMMGLKDFEGEGCILADDMGLGKTLQSIVVLWTLLRQGFDGRPAVRKAIVVCPTSLVKNWAGEIQKWLGDGCPFVACAESSRSAVEYAIDKFLHSQHFRVLIISYETFRIQVDRFLRKGDACCDMLVCDEAHRLKNAETATTMSLSSLPCRKRLLLSGTPMQNDLQEFFAMTDFTNPGVLGSPKEFRRRFETPILVGREPDASDAEIERAQNCQLEMSDIVNKFILRRMNTLNAKFLPPKLVQVVCCRMTEVQRVIYEQKLKSKELQHALAGRQKNVLGIIGSLMKLCNHPRLLPAEEVAPYLPAERGRQRSVHAEWSGKLFVLERLMITMTNRTNDKIVLVSNFTQTLDVMGRMCTEHGWRFLRLDGSTSVKKRMKMVDEFNAKNSPYVAFLLSSKAGGCGLNLVGANRLVLFDPDWNPAIDKQAAARVWREGQTKRSFVYRFLTTGTIEEKVFQRQLSKEGLQSIVDDQEEVNSLATKDLKQLFRLKLRTPSDTHDKLRCPRCLGKFAARSEDAPEEDRGMTQAQCDLCAAFIADLLALPEAFALAEADAAAAAEERVTLDEVRRRVEARHYEKGLPAFTRDVQGALLGAVKFFGAREEAEHVRKLQRTFETRYQSFVPRLLAVREEGAAPASGEGAGIAGEGAANGAEGGSQAAANGAAPGEDPTNGSVAQTGMPKEEDLNRWSHHHSAQSCDDEIFRLSQVGYDTVSFVFGLEVTWDLIQEQMKEDEEHQKAVEEEKELRREKMKRLAAEAEDLRRAKDEKKRARARRAAEEEEEGVATASEESSAEESAEESEGEESEGEESEGEETEGEGNEGDFEDPAAPASPPPPARRPAKRAAPVAVVDCASEGEEEQMLTIPPTPPTDGAPEPSVWSCGVCTFDNPKKKRKCDMCGSARPAARKKAKAR